MPFITTISILTTEIENGASHCSIESRGSRFYYNSFPPHQINVGGSGKASDNMTWINITITLEERGFFFLLNQTKWVNLCFPDCSYPSSFLSF